MLSPRTLLTTALIFGLVGGLAADESKEGAKKVKLGLKLSKGQKVAYVVTRSSEFKFERDGETRETSSSSKLRIKLEVKDVTDEGASVALSFGKVKSSFKGGERSFEFDSSKDDAEGEAVEAIKKVAEGTHEVSVAKDGRPGRLDIFGDVGGGGRGRRGGGLFTVFGSLQRDLGQILGAGLHEDELEVGKVSRASRGGRRPGGAPGEGRRRRPRDASANEGGREIAVQDQERPRQRRGFRGRGSSLRFEGAEGGKAKFAVLRAPFRRPDGDAAPEPVKIGEATYSLADGLLVKLSIKEGSPEGAPFQRKSSTTIERAGGAKEKPKPKKTESL